MESEAEFAPAKVNLALHVTGQRADGYHLLDSIVVHAGVGDRVTLAAGEGLRLTGPEVATLPEGGDNLCLRAAGAMGGGVAITLEKHLPVAAGLGGGSSDAAAVLRAMARLGRPLPDRAAVLALGADVPVCLAGHPCRMRGVGEELEPLVLPPFWLVLVNPRRAVATAAVFRALARRDNPPLPPRLPAFADAAALAAFLAAQRNDLEAPAMAIVPEICRVKTALAASEGCLLVRMSGSGASCFGLFANGATARAAARRLRGEYPDWWVAAAPALGAGEGAGLNPAAAPW